MIRSCMSVTLVLLVLTHLISGCIDIKSQSVGSVSINNGDANVYSNEDLETTISGLTPSGAKIIYDWKVDKGDGNGFNSLKLLDITFDGFKTADGLSRINNYMSENDVTVHGSPTYNPTSGHNGRGALAFNQDWVNRLEMENTISTTGVDFTFSFWAKCENTTQNQAFVCRENDGNISSYVYFSRTSGRVSLVLNSKQNDYLETIVDVTDYVGGVAFDQLYNFVIRRKGELVDIFVNGQLIPGGTNRSAINTSKKFVINTIGSNVNSSYPFHGVLDDIKLFDMGLTNEQILHIYQNGDNKILREVTKPGIKWKVCATPNDNIGDGAEVCSNEILIKNNYLDVGKYSLRFNSSVNNYLSRTPSTEATNAGKIWTYSVWIKNANIGVSKAMFHANDAANNQDYIGFRNSDLDANASNDGKIYLVTHKSSYSSSDFIRGETVMDDYSRWYHIVISYNSTLPLNTDRVKIWIDGKEEALTGTYPTQNNQTDFGRNFIHHIGQTYNLNPLYYYDGYMSELNFIDGISLEASDFGEMKNGKWIPISYSGIYGINGFCINFSNQSDPGKDYSGNNNHWTMVNYESRKDGDNYIDQMLDAPTRNFAVLNPEDKGSDIILSAGNLNIQGVSEFDNVRTTLSLKSGKTYAEAIYRNAENMNFGLVDFTINMDTYLHTIGSDRDCWFINIDNVGTDAHIYHGNSYKNIPNCRNGINKYDTIQLASDIKKGKLYIGMNGKWLDNSNPESDTENYTINTNKDYYFVASPWQSVMHKTNFGQGGQSGLKDMVIEEDGSWRLANNSEVPDARYKVLPPTGYKPLSENFFEPVVNFVSDNYKVTKGSTVKLKWNIDYATEVKAFSNDPGNQFTGNKVTNDSVDITLPNSVGTFNYWLEVKDINDNIVRDTVTIRTTNYYETDYSFRLNASSGNYLSRDITQTSNRKLWTVSCWIKLSDINTKQIVFGSSLFIPGAYGEIFYIDENNKINFTLDYGFNVRNVVSKQPISMNGAFTHVVCSYDINNLDFKIFVDGVNIETDINYPGINDVDNTFSSSINTVDKKFYIGKKSYSDPWSMDGYVSEFVFVDGVELEASDFGEFRGGKWLPKQLNIPDYGVNGFFLNFSDQKNPGKDFSGNGNDFSLFGYSADRTDNGNYIDQVLDSPNRNFAVLNYYDKSSSATLSDGGLGFSAPRYHSARATLKMSDSRWYMESKKNDYALGLSNKDKSLTTSLSSGTDANGYWQDGEINGFGGISSAPPPYNNNDVVSMTIDLQSKELFYYKNSQKAHSNAINLNENTDYYPITCSGTGHLNFGQGGLPGLKNFVWDKSSQTWREALNGEVPDARFAYAPPAGFRPLSENFNEPNIIEFNSTRYKVQKGSKIKLNWNVDYAIDIIASSDDPNDPFTGDINNLDTLEITLPNQIGEYQYRITASNSLGEEISDTVFIKTTEEYEVDYSLRFNSSDQQYLRRVPTIESNRKVYTLSFWMKRGKVDNGKQTVFSCNEFDNSLDETNLSIEDASNGNFRIQYNGSQNRYFENNDIIHDWQHIVWVTNLDAAEVDRTVLYINGIRQGVNSNSSLPGYVASISSTITNMNNINQPQTIARDSRKMDGYFDGYLAEMIFVDGQALTKDDFGETRNEKWMPKQPNISDYGVNGFYLNFSEQTNPGRDFSGNENHWTTEGTWTKESDGRYIDQMLDSPTRNFAVLDSDKKNFRDGDVVINRGNLRFDNTTTGNIDIGQGVATQLINNKIYWEAKTNLSISNIQRADFGVSSSDIEMTATYPGGDPVSYAYTFDHYAFNVGAGVVTTTSGSAPVLGENEVMLIAYNSDLRYLWFGKQGVWYGGGDPANGINQTLGLEDKQYYPSYGFNNGYIDAELNFGQGGQSDLENYVIESDGTWRLAKSWEVPDARFKYLPPSGFDPLIEKIKEVLKKRRIVITVIDL